LFGAPVESALSSGERISHDSSDAVRSADTAGTQEQTATVPATGDTVAPPTVEDSRPEDSPGGAGAVGADSAAADSARQAALRDSLLERQRRPSSLFLRHPTEPDSLFDPWTIDQTAVYQADVTGVSEILRPHPFFVNIPFTRTSRLNPVLHMVFPAAHAALLSGDGFLAYHSGGLLGTVWLSAGQIGSIDYRAPGALRLDLHPSGKPAPETVALWEGGVGAVFGENVLDVRFARPLTERLSLGVMSIHRSFLRSDYSHTSGGMYDLFSTVYDRLGLDSTYYSHKGRNPRTKEHAVTGRLRFDGGEGSRADVSYQYLDLHNDQSYGYRDSLDIGGLGWEEVADYRHRLRGRITRLSLGPMHLRAEALLGTEVNRTEPLLAGDPSRRPMRGEALQGGGGVGVSLPMATADTLDVSYAVQHDRRQRYNGTDWTVTHHAPSFGYALRRGTSRRGFHLGGGIGYTFAEVSDSLEQALRWRVNPGVRLGRQRLEFFAKQDVMPPVVPYDTTLRVRRGALLDRYLSYGAEARLAYGSAGIALGYTTMYAVADTGGAGGYGRAVSHVWPNGMPPYRQPGVAASLMPFFGPWHGLTLSSRWILADSRPYVKSLSSLSFSTGSPERSHYLDLSLNLRYWSRRDTLSYGGIDYWHRPIYDLGLRAAVQIRTFRLFYRMDNILNRQIAYVPGYFLPGLVFRWGFNWMIPS
jgi:hypothetical protein